MPNQFRNGSTCTLRLTARRTIAPDEELTHDYGVGDKSSMVEFPDPPATQSRARSSLRGAKKPKPTAKSNPVLPVTVSHPVQGTQSRARSSHRVAKKPTAKSTSPVLPVTFSHPVQGMMKVASVQKNGNCFLTCVARQLTAAKVPVPGSAKGKWGQLMLRKLLRKRMIEPEGEVDTSAMSEARKSFEAYQSGLSKESDPEMFTPEEGRPLSWNDIADDIKLDGNWVSPSIIQVVISLLKLDLCYVRVQISVDGDVGTDAWVDQRYEGDPIQANGERFVVYLRYTDDYRGGGTGHYDSCVPDDGKPTASAADLPKGALDAIRAAQTAAACGPGKGPNQEVVRNSGKGKGKAPEAVLAMAEAGNTIDSDEAMARDLARDEALRVSDTANAAQQSAKDAELAKQWDNEERTEAETRKRRMHDDAALAKRTAGDDGAPEASTRPKRQRKQIEEHRQVLDKTSMPEGAPPSSATGPVKSSKRKRKPNQKVV